MAANAIYFPYINVPPDPWLLRMLLYWDRLSAIVPMDYQSNPDLFEPKMRDMVSAGLVNAIAPGMYLGRLDGFAESFLKYADQWCRPGRNGRQWPQMRIHAEKLDYLVRPLVEKGIAHEVDGPWYEMPTPVANRFMAHLATALGQIDQVDAAPVTNSASLGQSLWKTGLVAKRDALLEILFPMPANSEKLTLSDIVEFKARHQALAARFRERVQEECILLPDGTTQEERWDRIQALGGRLQGEVGEIAEVMRGRWKKLVFGKVLPVLAPAIPLIDAVLPSQAAIVVGAAFSSGLAGYQSSLMHAADNAVRRRPLAYVALARRELFMARQAGSDKGGGRRQKPFLASLEG